MAVLSVDLQGARAAHAAAVAEAESARTAGARLQQALLEVGGRGRGDGWGWICLSEQVFVLAGTPAHTRGGLWGVEARVSGLRGFEWEVRAALPSINSYCL